MKNLPSKFKLACLLPGLLILNQLVYSQTTTIINYQTWTGATGCNIFGASTNVPVTVNGTNSTMAHLTNQGQPTYDVAPNNAVDLETLPNNSQIAGTQYQMTVNFKKYYSYKITINVANIVNSGSSALFFLNLNNGGNGGNTSCTGPTIFSQPTGGFVHLVPISGESFTDYVVNYNFLSSNENYLIVGAICASTYPASQYFLIRKSPL